MKTFELKGKARVGVGKKIAKQLRKQKLVPCILYGGEKNVPFSAEVTDFRHLIYSPLVQLVKLDIEGESFNAIIKEIQFHPLTDDILHVDFQQIFEDKNVIIGIPVQLVGTAKGAKAGGKIKLVKRKLKVKALPKFLPDNIDINIEDVDIDQSIKVGNLSVENLEFLDDKTAVIMTVLSTRAAAKTTGPAA